MADRKGFNGLRQIGSGVPLIGQQMGQPDSQQMKRAIGQQIAALSMEIFARWAANLVVELPEQGWPTPESYQAFAKHCHMAATNYFVGIGLITVETPAQTTSDEDQNPDASR